MVRRQQHLLLTHLWVRNTQQKLLLLGALGSWQVSCQKRFERVRNLVLSDVLDVFKGLLGSGEWLVSGKLNHLGKSFEGSNSLLDLAELTSSSIEFFLLEKAVT